MRGEKNTVYMPDKFITMSFFASLREMAISLVQSRELIWRLFVRDFSAKYRQSLLGILWVLLNPIVTVGIFVFLNRAGILNIGETSLPYSVFALIGLSIYGIFSTGLTACSNSIIGAGTMVVKINFPKISLVIASMGQSLVDFLVRLALVIILFIIYGITPQWTFLIFPFTVLPLVLLTLGLGLILSLLAGVFRDVIHLVSFFTTLFLFMMPVLYPAPQAGIFAALNAWNPLAHLIIGCRDFLVSGSFSDPHSFLWASVFSIFLFLISWRIFFISESRIAERV
jgi:lipopolysaccharide transport system permease protein